MISWWLLYLAKGPIPDFNNGTGNDLNNSRSLAPRRLFETYVNNDPPQAIPNLVSDGEYICSGLQLMVFWWVPYLSKGRMAQEVTRIVAPFWPPAFIRVQLE